MGIGTANPLYKLEVNGTASVTTLSLANALGISYGGTGTTTAPTQTGQLLSSNGTGWGVANLINGTNITLTTSTAGSITVGLSGQIGASNGGTGTSTTPTQQGQLLAADSTGSKYAPTTLVNGANITITTSTAGSITIAASGLLSGIGSGNKGYLATWNGSNTLAQGKLIDDGTSVGINATTTSYNFNLQGSAGVDPFNAASSSASSLFVIKGSGNVGVGSSSPIATFAVVATTTSATQQIMSIGTSTQGQYAQYLG